MNVVNSLYPLKLSLRMLKLTVYPFDSKYKKCAAERDIAACGI